MDEQMDRRKYRWMNGHKDRRKYRWMTGQKDRRRYRWMTGQMAKYKDGPTSGLETMKNSDSNWQMTTANGNRGDFALMGKILFPLAE